MLWKIRHRLVDDVEHFWKWWSTRLNLVVSMVLGYVLVNPTALPDFVKQLPASMQGKLWIVGPLWFVVMLVARTAKQNG